MLKTAPVHHAVFAIHTRANSGGVRLRRCDIMYMNKWYCTVAATLLQICGGLCYTFSLFSPSLKVQFHSQLYFEADLHAVVSS